MSFNDTTPFEPPFSVLHNPRLEFVMEVRLTFPEVHTIAPHPNGGMRTAVLVSGGTFEGPRLKGRAPVLPGNGLKDGVAATRLQLRTSAAGCPCCRAGCSR